MFSELRTRWGGFDEMAMAAWASQAGRKPLRDQMVSHTPFGYPLWVAASDATLSYPAHLAEDASRGLPFPGSLLRSCSVFIPKREHAEDLERIMRRVKGATSHNLDADIRQTDRRDTDRRVVGRQMADNIIEVEGALYEFPQLADALPAIILLGSAQAFPSLACVWLLSVLRTLGINEDLLNVMTALDTVLYSTIYRGGRELSDIIMPSGIKQVVHAAAPFSPLQRNSFSERIWQQLQ